MRVSVLILTKDEEVNLPDCLASVAWCDDVLVLDSGSTDRTLEIARQAGARTMVRPFDNFAGQRNFGLESGNLRHEWVLHLDADERVEPKLRDEMLAIANQPAPTHDAWYVASRLMFLGKWLRFSSGFPVWQMRFATRAFRFVQHGHAQREAEHVKAGYLAGTLRHHAFAHGLDRWFARHNVYSRDEARNEHERRMPVFRALGGLFVRDGLARRRALKCLVAHLPFRPTLRLIHMGIFHLGILDGPRGWTYCRLVAMYERMIVLKRRELAQRARGRAL